MGEGGLSDLSKLEYLVVKSSIKGQRQVLGSLGLCLSSGCRHDEKKLQLGVFNSIMQTGMKFI